MASGAALRPWINNRNVQFWSFQAAGWLGISLVSYLSLNLWYNQPEFSYIAHNIVQSLLGMLLSWPLRGLFSRWWTVPAVPRLALILGTVVVVAALWSVLRLLVFMELTGETGLWSDFGGWLYSSIFIFLAWTAFYHGIKYYEELQREHRILLEVAATQREETLRRIEAESLARQAQLKMLRYQLNPHFLFNTLNSLSSLVVSNQAERANQMILQLSHFLRYSLASDLEQEVPLQQEVDALHRYLKIEQARFGERLQVIVELSDESHQCAIPSLLLQPLVENAIKYAIAPAEQGGTLKISARCEGDQLVVAVDDSGPGLGEQQGDRRSGTGVGLNNVRERLTNLYGEQCALVMARSDLGGLRAEIHLPRRALEAA